MYLNGGTSFIHEYHAASHDWAIDRSINRDRVLAVGLVSCTAYSLATFPYNTSKT